MTTASESAPAPDGSITVTFSSYSATCVPQIWYRVDGGANVELGANPGSIVISKPGTTVVEYWANDYSTPPNVEETRRLEVHVAELAAPRVITGALTDYVGSATVTLTADGNGSSVSVFQARLDSEPTQTVTSGAVTFSTFSPGAHAIHYYVQNTAGQAKSGSISFVVEPVVRSVVLTANLKELTYPSIVELVAVASNPETTTARLQAKRVDKTVWEDLGTPVTSATNQFVFLDVPRYGYSYRVLVGSVSSNEVTVAVHVPLSKPHLSDTRIKVGRTLHLSGTIRPKHGAATEEIKYRLYWQRYSVVTRRWTSSGMTTMTIDPANDINSDTSKWMRDLHVRTVGTWRVRFFHECPRHKASYSPWTTFWVIK